MTHVLDGALANVKLDPAGLTKMGVSGNIVKSFCFKLF